MSAVAAERSTELARQTKLAVLWLIQIVNYTSYIFISELESIAVITESTPGQDSFVLAVFYFVPCLLIWLTFAGPRLLSRWLNIIFGALFALLKLVATFGAITGDIVREDGTVSPALIFNELWAIPAAALIVWIAWREGVQGS